LIEKILSYKTLFFNLATTISYSFLPLVNKILHAVLLKACTSGSDPLSLSPVLKRHPPPHCAHIHCLVSINVQQMLMVVSGCNFSCMEKFNSTHLLHMHFMSDAVLLAYPSAAICHTSTTCNGILVGRLSFYCHTANICLCCGGPTS